MAKITDIFTMPILSVLKRPSTCQAFNESHNTSPSELSEIKIRQMGIDFNERDIRNTLPDEGVRRFTLEQHLNNPAKGHRAKADEENQT